MLDHILNTAQTFEKLHGIAPDVIYINPFHCERLYKYHSDLFQSDQGIYPGFRLVIFPGSVLAHPERR